ncbi:MAG: hypothetical protein QOJ90_1715 [Actinomycetota bacterium]|jgi:cold shock CspA family protein|nr:hypothetical protein [Actinomycetota bacterium]
MGNSGTATGTVRLWMRDDDWGVIDSDELPGSCWADLSAVDDHDGELRAGQVVEVDWTEPGPTGYRCRATRVRVTDELQTSPGA